MVFVNAPVEQSATKRCVDSHWQSGHWKNIRLDQNSLSTHVKCGSSQLYQKSPRQRRLQNHNAILNENAAKQTRTPRPAAWFDDCRLQRLHFGLNITRLNASSKASKCPSRASVLKFCRLTRTAICLLSFFSCSIHLTWINPILN